jgi:hypothetical protein
MLVLCRACSVTLPLVTFNHILLNYVITLRLHLHCSTYNLPKSELLTAMKC